MYLIGRVTERNLDTVKAGDNIQVVFIAGYQLQDSTSMNFVDNVQMNMYQQTPYRFQHSLENCSFHTISRRAKRTLFFEDGTKNIYSNLISMFRSNYPAWPSGYFLVVKCPIVDLDEDDDQCI